MGTDPLRVQRYNLWRWAKRRASRLNLPFTLTPDDICIPAKCPVLGTLLRPGRGTSHGASPTLDRLIPELGYVPGNVLVVSARANAIKSTATVGELRDVAAFYEQLFHDPAFKRAFTQGATHGNRPD